MTKDPVCGKEVDQRTAKSKVNHQGQEFLFCSDSCRQKFDLNPERYAQRQAPQQQQHGGGAA